LKNKLLDIDKDAGSTMQDAGLGIIKMRLKDKRFETD